MNMGCLNANLVTPIKARKRIGDVKEPIENERYKKMVKKLIYLSHTKPNITFGVNMVSQHTHSQKEM